MAEYSDQSQIQFFSVTPPQKNGNKNLIPRLSQALEASALCVC